MEVCNIVLEAVTKTITKEKKRQSGCLKRFYKYLRRKKKSERQGRKGKIYSTECRDPENNRLKGLK